MLVSARGGRRRGKKRGVVECEGKGSEGNRVGEESCEGARAGRREEGVRGVGG